MVEVIQYMYFILIKIKIYKMPANILCASGKIK